MQRGSFAWGHENRALAKNENLMAFGDEAQSAAMANCGYFYIMANYRKNPETQISFSTFGDANSIWAQPGGPIADRAGEHNIIIGKLWSVCQEHVNTVRSAIILI